MNMPPLRQKWLDACNMDALHRRLTLSLNDGVKLKLKHVDPDNREEEAVGSYRFHLLIFHPLGGRREAGTRDSAEEFAGTRFGPGSSATS
jgi:hypothetical protein